MEQHEVTGDGDGLAASDLVIETTHVTPEETAAIYAVLQSVAHGSNRSILSAHHSNAWARSLGPLRSSTAAENFAWKK